MGNVYFSYLERITMQNSLRILFFFLFAISMTLLIGCGNEKELEKLRNQNSQLENRNIIQNRQLGSISNELDHVKKKLRATEKELSKLDGYDRVIQDALEYQKKQKLCQEVAIQRDILAKKVNAIEKSNANLTKQNKAITAEHKKHYDAL